MIFLPFFLILNCFSLFFFKKWLGPLGLFYSSVFNFILIIFSLLYIYFFITLNNSYIFLDMGRWFYLLDIIDSNLIFILDNLSILLSLLVLFLTVFAQYFGIEYMYREAFITRLLYLLNFFATSVIFLFLVFDFFLILIVWEFIGLFSLLLVNFYSTRIYTIKASFKTFIFSRFSDIFIFFIFLNLIIFFNTTDLTLIFIEVPFFIFFNIYIFNFSFNIINLLSFSLIIASSIKSAQFLFHTWLPDAMEAPTPASALIHSSTLVIMGIFLIIRFNILFDFSFLANFFLIFLGAITIAFGSVVAFFQNDLKKLVAFSTISQMGYLFCGCGFMCYKEVVFYLIIHALNKAFLFILVGYIVHFYSGNTDLRYMGSLYIYSLFFMFITLIISLNLTGLPFTSGFIAKEFLVFQTFKDFFFIFLIRSFWFISFIFTPLYMLNLNLKIFFNIKKSYLMFFNNNSFLNFFKFNPFYFSFNFKKNFLLARFSVLIYLFFFFFINFIGEFFILIIFDLFGSNNIFFFSDFFIKKYSIFNFNNIFNFSLTYIFNIIIYSIIIFIIYIL